MHDGKTKSSFYLNCDPSFQINDVMSAAKWILPYPLGNKCKSLQADFDQRREDVNLVPPSSKTLAGLWTEGGLFGSAKCIQKRYVYSGARDTWHKCCLRTG